MLAFPVELNRDEQPDSFPALREEVVSKDAMRMIGVELHDQGLQLRAFIQIRDPYQSEIGRFY